MILIALTLSQLALASSECNIFLEDEGRSSYEADITDADMDELIFMAEFSRFMNEISPRLLQVKLERQLLNFYKIESASL